MGQQDGTLLLYVNDAGIHPEPSNAAAELAMVMLNLGRLVYVSELACIFTAWRIDGSIVFRIVTKFVLVFLVTTITLLVQ